MNFCIFFDGHLSWRLRNVERENDWTPRMARCRGEIPQLRICVLLAGTSQIKFLISTRVMRMNYNRNGMHCQTTCILYYLLLLLTKHREHFAMGDARTTTKKKPFESAKRIYIYKFDAMNLVECSLVSCGMSSIIALQLHCNYILCIHSPLDRRDRIRHHRHGRWLYISNVHRLSSNSKLMLFLLFFWFARIYILSFTVRSLCFDIKILSH